MRAPEVVLFLFLCYLLVCFCVRYLLRYSTTSGAHGLFCYRPWVIHPRLLKCSPSGYKLASTFSRHNSQRSASYESEKLKVKNEKSKCIVVSTCKQYVCNWIFHSSLLLLHLNMLLANSVGDNSSNYFNFRLESTRLLSFFAMLKELLLNYITP